VNAFRDRVYTLVSQVPLGMVTTYGAIARALGDPRKAREVGWALASMPEVCSSPAHRVVNRVGELSGGWAFGAPEVQRRLLEAEGVDFTDDDRVDMRHHFWSPGDGESAPHDPEQTRLL
jgi:methylated-DNA-protein-cysteine methyltransferase related protein